LHTQKQVKEYLVYAASDGAGQVVHIYIYIYNCGACAALTRYQRGASSASTSESTSGLNLTLARTVTLTLMGRWVTSNFSPNLNLAFTRYSFTSKLLCTIQSSFSCPPPHVQCPHCCNTIARPLRNERPPSDPPCVRHTPNNIGNGKIM